MAVRENYNGATTRYGYWQAFCHPCQLYYRPTALNLAWSMDTGHHGTKHRKLSRQEYQLASSSASPQTE